MAHPFVRSSLKGISLLALLVEGFGKVGLEEGGGELGNEVVAEFRVSDEGGFRLGGFEKTKKKRTNFGNFYL